MAALSLMVLILHNETSKVIAFYKLVVMCVECLATDMLELYYQHYIVFDHLFFCLQRTVGLQIIALRLFITTSSTR